MLLLHLIHLLAQQLQRLRDLFCVRGHDVRVRRGIRLAGEYVDGIEQRHQAAAQAGIPLCVQNVQRALHVLQDIARLLEVALVAVLLAVALIQKRIALLRNAHDVNALSGHRHAVAGKARGILILRERHLLDALAGIALGIPVHKVLSRNINALLGRRQAFFCRVKAQKSRSDHSSALPPLLCVKRRTRRGILMPAAPPNSLPRTRRARP